MRSLAKKVGRLLSERGHLFLGEAEPPRSVAIRRECTAFMASLVFPRGTQRVVVKEVQSYGRFDSLRDLIAFHNGLNSFCEGLDGRVPRFLGADVDDQLIVIECIDGVTLRRLVERALRPASPGVEACDNLLIQAAEALADLQRMPAAKVGLPCRPRKNSTFLPDFEASWGETRIARFLPGECRSPEKLYQDLPAAFFGRDDEHLLLSDTQPKNILVRHSDGAPCFIDIDYTGGNPAITVAHFLVSLDRLGLRASRAARLKRISAWKQSFLSAYCRRAAPSVSEDLAFFYPWCLLQNLKRHLNYRPLLGWYLGPYYGAQLREFLLNRRPCRLVAGAASPA